MTTSNDTITRQDIQIAVHKLNSAMVESAPKVQLFFELLGGTMRYWIEQAEGSRQVRNAPALPLIVDHVEHQEIKELRQENHELRRQLEWKQYVDQDWFST